MPEPFSHSSDPSTAFDRLFVRMRQQGEFPGLSGVVSRILNLSSSDRESVASLTNEILKDVGLTQRLLRLVNTVHYSRGQAIRTVSRAVSLVGFNGIRNLTLSLVLLEHMRDRAHAARLREEFLRVLVAGAFARELAGHHGDGEEAFIAAMFRNLGRLLAEFYFSDDARKVRERMAAQPGLSETAASIEVYGVSHEQLALKVARLWGLPDIVLRALRTPVDSAIPQEGGLPPDERLQWTALAANELARTVLDGDPKEQGERLQKVCERHGRALELSVPQALRAVARAREQFGDLAATLGLDVDEASSTARMLRAVSGQSAPSVGSAASDAGNPPRQAAGSLARAAGDPGSPGSSDSSESGEMLTTPGALGPPSVLPEDLEDDGTPAASAHRSLDGLMAGIQDVASAMVEDHRLVDILRMVLEAMLRAMDFDRVVFCMRDPKAEALTGRVGLGSGVEAIVRVFHVNLAAPGRDLFAAVCAKGADTLITDAAESRVRDRLPTWFHDSVGASTFLVLPLRQAGAPFGLIYADRCFGRPPLVIDDRELALLRTLRNQAVLAFKQSRG